MAASEDDLPDAFTAALTAKKKGADAPAEPDPFTKALGAPVAKPVVTVDPYSGLPFDPATQAKDTGPLGSLPIMPAPAPGAIGRIAQAGKEGFQGSPDLLTPEAKQYLIEHGGPLDLGRNITVPAANLGSDILALGGGLFRGGQQFLQEAISPIDPRLGRDVAAMPEAFPTGNIAEPGVLPRQYLAEPPAVQPSRYGAPGPAQTAEVYPPAAAPQGPAPAFAPPGEPRPPAQLLEPPQPAASPAFVPVNPQAATPEGVPLPSSVGAAASREGTPPGQIALSPREAANSQLVADLGWLTKTKQPGVADPNIYLDGITPTKAQIEQSVTAARELKELKIANPAIAQEDAAVADLHNDIRKKAYGDQAGSQLTTARQLDFVNQKIENDLANVWRNKGDADSGGIIQQIQTELSGSAGELPPMKSAMGQISDSVARAGTDPQKLYASRRLVNYMQSKAGQRENPGYGDADVQRALVNVKGAMDQAIEPAAPGFQKAMSDYSNARGPLDAQSELQDRELGLLDSKGVMQYSKVHKLMGDVILGRSPESPTNPFQGLSDGQMTTLKNIHDDLQRVATARDLAAASGSDTAQNLVGLLKQYAKGAAVPAAVGIANKVIPGSGIAVLGAKHAILDPILGARAARRQVREGMAAIHPDMSKYPNPNYLEPP